MNSVWTQVSLLASQVHISVESKAEIQTYFSSDVIKYAPAFSLVSPARRELHRKPDSRTDQKQ